MTRTVPLVIAFLAGITMIIQFFIPHQISVDFLAWVNRWALIILGFAVLIGLISLIKINWSKVMRKSSNWGFSIVTLVGIFVTLILGFGWGKEEGSPVQFEYNYVMMPMQATMFSLLAFYIVSASFRTFRARTPEATLLLAGAIVVMFGMVPIGKYIWGDIPGFAQWILDVPNMASKRGIMIGVALGSISMSLKIILGIERNWLGGSD